MTIECEIAAHAGMVVDEIKNTLGEKWDSLSDTHKSAAQHAARRIITLEWDKRNGVDVDDDFEFVMATVNGFKLVGEIALYDAFLEGLKKALEAFGSFLVGVGKGLLPGLGGILNGSK